jgi:multidrug resistance protein, MATE family
LAFERGYGLHGLFIGVTVSLIYCAGWGTYLCLGTDWEKEVRKVEKRIANERDRKRVVCPEGGEEAGSERLESV